MRINHNLASLNTYRQLSSNGTNTQKSLEKLSSGLRINKAGDDAAGLAISEKMRGQIRGLDQASSNAQNGISLIQTAEGALNETHSILQRMRELSVQSATDTNTLDDRTKIQSEVDQLAKEITRISNTTEFNTQNLLAGGLNDTFQIGANQGQNINLTVSAMDAQSLGVAGSTVSQSSFSAAGGISSVANIGSGLTTQTYKVTTTATAGTAAAALNGGGATMTGTMAVGTFVGTFTGATTETGFKIRVDAAAANVITNVSFSHDNGATWSASTAYSGGMTVASGLTWTQGATAATGEILTANLTAASYSAQLRNAASVGVGAVVTFNNATTSATIGDGSLGATAQINFAAGGITATANTDLFGVLASTSTVATLGVGGTVTTLADTKAGINVSGQGAANTAITTIDNAIKTVSNQRSNLGAMQNRLEHTIANLGTSSENLTAAESRVRDVDMAKEMMEFTKNNILSQAAQAMLAQANQQPQGVLQLLR